jgi:hypothetical protein
MNFNVRYEVFDEFYWEMGHLDFDPLAHRNGFLSEIIIVY